MRAVERRRGMGAKEGISAKSYIQDGLVAMWDGVENAGWGKHTSDPTKMVEIISRNFVGDVLDTRATWSASNVDSAAIITDNGIKNTTKDKIISINFPIRDDFGIDYTIEACITYTTARSTNASDFVNFLPTNSQFEFYLYPTELRIKGDGGNWNTGLCIVRGFNHIALVQRPNKTAMMYRNGSTKSKTGHYVPLVQTNSVVLGIQTTGHIMTIHSFRIYNRALTVDELTKNNEIDQQRFVL